MEEYYAQEKKPSRPEPSPPPPPRRPEPSEPCREPDVRELPEHVEPDEPWPRR